MARRLEVVITGDTSQLERSFNRAGRQTESFGARFAGMASRVGNVAGLAASAAAAYELGSGFKDVAEKATLLSETNAIIASTGGAANVTADHITAMADSLEKMSLADDKEIQKGEDLLLTFTNIQNRVGDGNDIYDQATKVMLDMSQVMGQDVSQTAIQVGKALNDPIGGVTALRRVGVQLSDQQQQQVKDFMAVGDVASAQKVIIGELTREFGGAAQAAQDSKPWDLLKDNLDDVAEEIAGRVMPHLLTLTHYLNDNLTPSLYVAAGAVAALTTTMLGLKVGSLAVSLGLASTAGPFGLFGAAIATVGIQIALLWTQWDRLKQAFVDNAWLQAVAVPIAGFVIAFNPVTRTIVTVVVMLKELQTATGAVIGAFWGMVGAVSGAVGAIQGAVSGAFSAVVGVVSGAAWGAYGAVASAFGAMVGVVGGAIGAMIGIVAAIPGQILGAIGDLGGLLYNAGSSVIDGLINGIRDATVGKLQDTLDWVSSKIPDWKGPLDFDERMLVPAGHAIIGGLVRGIDERVGTVKLAMQNVTGAIQSPQLALSAPGSVRAPGNSYSFEIVVNGATSPEATADAVYRKIMDRLERDVRMH